MNTISIPLLGIQSAQYRKSGNQLVINREKINSIPQFMLEHRPIYSGYLDGNEAVFSVERFPLNEIFLVKR